MSINKIVVVGGGSAGWMTAATLIKSFPDKEIVVIESKDVPIVGVGESTLGGIKRWTRYIGLDEKDFFPHTDASVKMSIKFTDFYKKDAGAFHYPFGVPMVDGERNPINDWHLKKYYYPNTPVTDMVDCLFPASALFNTNKFSLNENGQFGNYNPKNDVAYHFDAVKFGGWLRDRYCVPRGVTHLQSMVVDIDTDDSGIKTLIMEDGSKVTSDLFIDCTGFRSLLLAKTLNEPFISYSDLLPNNKALAVQLPYKDRDKELEAFTNSTAIGNGWCWNIPLWSRLGTGYVYSDKYVSTEDAKEEFKQYLMSDKMVIPRTQEEVDALSFKDITMRVGIHKRTFVKNVVAIGLSAGFIEPLESNGLFSVHEFLFKLVDILQRKEVNQFDKDLYNVSVHDLFDGFAKFVAMHYALSHRDDTPYWEDIQNRSFIGTDGDPYTPYVSKTDNFNDLALRYFGNWGHTHPNITNGGIAYISTGMHLYMANLSRMEQVEYAKGYNIKEVDINPVVSKWELNKRAWRDAAKESKTLVQYLKDEFYNEG
jgi:flavin-dependent dehydrogenase